MGWQIQENKLQRTGGVGISYDLTGDTGSKLPADTWVPVLPGNYCRIKFSNQITVIATDNAEKVTLQWLTETTVTFEINPLIPLLQKVGKQFIAWGFEKEGDAQAASTPFIFKAIFSTASEVTLDAENILWTILPVLQNLSIPDIETKLFSRPLLKFVETVHEIEKTIIEISNPRWDKEIKCLVFSPKVKLHIGKEEIELSCDQLAIDQNLHLVSTAGNGLTLSGRTKKDHYLLQGNASPLSLGIPQETQINIAISLADPAISLQRADGQPVMRLFLPGVEIPQAPQPTALQTFDPQDRFQLDFYAQDKESAVEWGRNGLSGRAVAKPTKLSLGVLQVMVEQGELNFLQGRYEANLTARATLPHFTGAKGALQVFASSQGDFSARWTMVPAPHWTDPSGYLQVLEPSATVEIDYKDNKWDLKGRLGGRLELVKAPTFLGDAGNWLQEFTKKFSLTFSDLSLSDFNKSDFRIQLKPLSRPTGLDLWGVFKFDLTSLALRYDGLDFGGNLSFDRLGLRFSGKLPQLRLQFHQGIRISRAAGDDFTISGSLTTPTGISAEIDLRRVQNEDVDELAGTGSLSIPSFPGIAITCSIGRRATDRELVFLLFTSADYPIQLFPGVVMRNTGLGFAMNKVIKGLNGEPTLLLKRLMGEGGKIPDPSRLEDWEISDSGATEYSLAAQTYLAPSPTGDGPFPYVARSLVYSRLSSDFVLLFGTNLWLCTNLDDAKTDQFQRRPVMQGAMVLYPRHGLLEMEVATCRNPLMSDAPALLTEALSKATCEFRMKASRDSFLYRVGPLQIQTSVMGIQLSGHGVYGVQVVNGSGIALFQASMAADLKKDSPPLHLGPVSAGFRFALKLAFETLLAGGVVKDLGVVLYGQVKVYVSVELAAWVKISFSITIRIWKFKKTISWSMHKEASFKLAIDLLLELALTKKNSALHGLATVNIRLFGYDFNPSLEIGDANAGALKHRATILQTLATIAQH